MDSVEHALVLKEELVTNEEQHDLDKLGIAKNSREEKMRARDAKQKEDPAYNARMASLYREVVLKEKPVVAENGFIPLGALSNPAIGGNAPAPTKSEAEPVLGD
jgi:hypothetical protein